MVAVALGLIRALSSDSGTLNVANHDPQPYSKRDSSILILKMEKAPAKKVTRSLGSFAVVRRRFFHGLSFLFFARFFN